MLFKQKYTNFFNSRGVIFFLQRVTFFLQQVSFFLHTSVFLIQREENNILKKDK